MRTLLVFCFFVAHLAKASPILQPKPISLGSFQSDVLQVDLPVSDFHLDAEASTLWFTGKRNLWKWDLASNRLKKIGLVSDQLRKYQRVKFVAKTDEAIVAATNFDIYKIDTERSVFAKYKMPFANGGILLGVEAGGKNLWFIHSGGLAHLTAGGEMTGVSWKMPLLRRDTPYYLDVKKNLFFFASGGDVYVKATMDPARTAKRIYSSKWPIKNIFMHGSSLIFQTQFSVVRADEEGKPQQIIPVENARKIAAAGMNERFHGYLFDDAMLELFDMQTKQKREFQVRSLLNESITKMMLANQYAVFLGEGGLRVFALPASMR